MLRMIAALGAALALSVLDEADQREFWNERNAKYRRVEKIASLDHATLRRRDTILRWLSELDLNQPRILDLGCSTRWFTARLATYGRAARIDLADASIEEARKRFPQFSFECANSYAT